MHLLKTTLVTGGAATLLFLVWVSVLVQSIPGNMKTFGMGLVCTPLLSAWFWIAVFVVGALYFRFTR